jgi:hypothetical protein
MALSVNWGKYDEFLFNKNALNIIEVTEFPFFGSIKEKAKWKTVLALKSTENQF